METVPIDDLKEKEGSEFTIKFDDDLNPRIATITIPIGYMAIEKAEGRDPLTPLAGAMLQMQIKILKTINILVQKKLDAGLIKTGKILPALRRAFKSAVH